MYRRTFFRHSMGLLGGSLLPAAIASLRTPELIFGQNEKRYRLDRDWVKATPSQLPVNDCHEMLQDSHGNILLLTNETRNNVIVFDKGGRLQRTFGTEYPGAHGFSKAGEGSDEHFYITDTERHQVIKVAPDGKVIRQWDFPDDSGKYTAATEFVPTETAATDNGEFYVADGYGAQFILHYAADGNLKNIFGGRGEGDEHLDNAHGICIDRRTTPHTLLVTDRTRCCFKRFSLDGQYLGRIDLPGACVCRPVIKGDYLYAAVLRSPDMGLADSGFVIILNKQDRVVSTIGGAEPAYIGREMRPAPFYQTIRLFKHPHDVLVDDEENLYVCQWNSGKVYPYKFTPAI